ncbi:hypothetical protein QE152_g22221 [Popillia japonica]|uniref:Uncharacterized protein n=1 Tax=Popillia japonica TaxID=7064 RepID=A0AAW1KKX9_POPJA
MVGAQKDFIAHIATSVSKQVNDYVPPLKLAKMSAPAPKHSPYLSIVTRESRMSAPAPKHSPYLSIVTRTEIISESECAVFAVNEDRLMYYPAQLLMGKECKHELPRGSVVCALIQLLYLDTSKYEHIFIV